MKGALGDAGRLAGRFLVFKTAWQLSVLLPPLNLGHLHFRARRREDSQSAFWSHATLAVLANPSPSRSKRHSLRHGVTSQGQAARAWKGRAERSVADFPHPEAVQGSNNAQRPATKLPFVPFWATLWTPLSDRSCMAICRHLWCCVLAGIVPGKQKSLSFSGAPCPGCTLRPTGIYREIFRRAASGLSCVVHTNLA